MTSAKTNYKNKERRYCKKIGRHFAHAKIYLQNDEPKWYNITTSINQKPGCQNVMKDKNCYLVV